MPTTAAAALVLVIAISPGALGSYLFDLMNGLSWRERDWGAAVRYGTFSTIGLAVYAVVAAWLELPPPIHALPGTYLSKDFQAASIASLAFPFLGHLTMGGLTGICAAAASRFLAGLTSQIPYPGAWDAFVRSYVSGRWVVVTLTSGDVYAGYLQVADAGVAPEHRDLVLRNPARFEGAERGYVVTAYYDMYIPAALVQNLASVRKDGDTPVGPGPGQPLWGEVRDEEAIR